MVAETDVAHRRLHLLARFSAAETITQKRPRHAQAAGSGRKIVVRFAQRFPDQVINDGVDGETLVGETPVGIAPPSGRGRGRFAEVGEVELGAAEEYHFAFNFVGEFASVARPALGEKTRFPGRRDRHVFQPMPPGL